MYELRMPQLALGEEEVTVVRWLKEAGEGVAAGEPVLEVETDKASMDVESPFAGTLAVLLAEPGATVAPRQVVALVAAPGESLDEAAARAAAVPPRREQAARGRSSAPASRRPWSAARHVRHGELGGLPAPARAAPDPGRSARDEPLGRRRRAIARRLAAAAAIPQFSVSRKIGVAAALVAVERERGGGVPATLTDALVVAVARAAIAVPRVNAWLLGDALRLHRHVGLALAVDTPEGVVAPVLGSAESLAIAQVAELRADLVERARAGTLAERELEGGTLTLSNIGGFGADAVAPLVTPPQVAVVGVGRARGELAAAAATVTLVCDHRALDGADGARYLAALADELERLGPAGGDRA